MSKSSILDIKDILNDYCVDIQDGISQEAQTISRQAVDELKVTSPKRPRSGKYAKGWTVNTKKGRGIINCTVWNAKHWRLTHLLENGHITRNGRTRAKAIKHIEPVEKKCVDAYTKGVEKIIKNGG